MSMDTAQGDGPAAGRERPGPPPAVRRAPNRRQAELAHQILEHLRSARFPRGHHLTEEGLAARFRVSRTPVRAALRLLAARRVLDARPNQGYFLALSEEEVQGATLELPPSADESLYLSMSSDRFDERLPETVTEAALLRRYAVGRPLLLNVLARMSAEGLVRRSRGRGWIFQPILKTRESIDASYRFRLAIEPAGLREEAFRLEPAVLASLRQVHRDLLDGRSGQEATSRLFEVDAQFHEALALASGNVFFRKAIEQQNSLRRLGEYRSYADQRRLATWCREHLAILDCLERGDRDTAARTMERHLENARAFGLRADGRPDG